MFSPRSPGATGHPSALSSFHACSSAAGGLRMVTVGLVRELTAEAARQAALGAGARLVGTFAYRLTAADVFAIERLAPDILLLAGGTDGGNSEVVLHEGGFTAGERRGRTGADGRISFAFGTADQIQAALSIREHPWLHVISRDVIEADRFQFMDSIIQDERILAGFRQVTESTAQVQANRPSIRQESGRAGPIPIGLIFPYAPAPIQ